MADVRFPQLIQRACGIDVHLKVVIATIDVFGLQRETRSFATFTSSLTELKEWLLFNGITHVAMESTGASYRELGAQYMQEKLEKKRKAYLSGELKKLGYTVSLEKKPPLVTEYNENTQGRLLLELP